MDTHRDRVAHGWVESPLQLLSAVECFQRGLLGSAATVVPRPGLPALERTASELRALGLPRGLALPASPPVPPCNARWLVGDAFSGMVQRRLLVARRLCEVVVVDDGLATMHLLDLLTRRHPAPVVRARLRPGPARLALGVATARRLRALARAGRLVVFTAFTLDDELARAAQELGVRVVANDFPWLRAQPVPAAPPESVVVLGSSLVANDLVHAEPYLEWVRGLARAEPVAYLPHRREDARTLDPLRDEPGVVVHDVGAPAELRLRGLGERHRLVSLPSTAVTSLRALLAPTGAAVDARTVPEGWWTERARPGLRAHLDLTAQENLAATAVATYVPTPATALLGGLRTHMPLRPSA